MSNRSDVEKREGQKTAAYEYNTLMRLLGASVSKHLMDEHFTLILAKGRTTVANRQHDRDHL